MCNYCDFYKTKLVNDEQVKKFQEYLKNNINQSESFLKENHSVIGELKTLYVGGGTPSLWGAEGAQFLKKHIIDKYGLCDEYEFTIEIDPDSWSKSDIQKWIEVGVNRFSIGAQSFNDNYLKTMDRNHNSEQIRQLLSYLKSIEANYSVDIMLGLPSYDESRDIHAEVLDFITYQPSHFSVYILKTRSNYIHKNNLPDDDDTALEYSQVCTLLDKMNYKQYEVSNFAIANKKSEHNLMYWRCQSVAALGPNATGFLNFFDSAKRYQWKSSGAGQTSELLDKEALQLETIYMGLRSKLGFDFKDFDRVGVQACIARWRALEYIEKLEDYHVFLSSKGYLMLDSIIDNLFSKKII